MRFQVLDIVPHAPHPTVLLGALAQATDRILLSTGVTVLSLLDPVRVAEDYATVDQLSGGRLEIVIGKGNEDQHFPLFGRELSRQYEYLTENYELLRRLLRAERVSWTGTHRADLDGVTTHPRPFDGPFRIWHGPVKLAEHGHDPAAAYVGSGSGGLFLADTDEAAIAQYRPIYEGFAAKLAARHAGDDRVGKTTAFATIEDAVAHGPALVGTPERVAAKIVDHHAAYRHDVQSVSINPVLPYPLQQEVLTRFAEEVVPLVRRELSTTLWSAADPGRGRGFTARETLPA